MPSKSIFLVFLMIIVASAYLLAESFTEPGIYIVNGWGKPCTIKRWSQLDDSFSIRSCNEPLVDVSFFIKRMGAPRKSKETGQVVGVVPNKAMVSNVRNKESNGSGLQTTSAEPEKLTEEAFYLSEEGWGLVDVITKSHNLAFTVDFNNSISSYFKEKPGKKGWALSLNLRIRHLKNKISSGLRSEAVRVLCKLFPENPEWGNIIVSGEFNRYAIFADHIESEAEKLETPGQFKSWAEGFFTHINRGDPTTRPDHYSREALKSLIEKLILSKGGSL